MTIKKYVIWNHNTKGNLPYCHRERTLDDQAPLALVLVEADGWRHLPEENENKGGNIKNHDDSAQNQLSIVVSRNAPCYQKILDHKNVQETEPDPRIPTWDGSLVRVAMAGGLQGQRALSAEPANASQASATTGIGQTRSGDSEFRNRSTATPETMWTETPAFVRITLALTKRPRRARTCGEWREGERVAAREAILRVLWRRGNGLRDCFFLSLSLT